MRDFQALDQEQRWQALDQWRQQNADHLNPQPEEVERPYWYITKQGQSVCLLCKAWSDQVHQRSVRHIRRARAFLEADRHTRQEWLEARREEVNALGNDLRGGAGRGLEDQHSVEEARGSGANPQAQDAGSSSSAASSANSERPPLARVGGVPGGVCGLASLPSATPGLGGPMGAGGSATEMMDDDNDVVPDQVQHPATRYTIHLMAARLRTTMFVCEHAGLDSLRSTVATMMRSSPSRICFLQDNAVVPFAGSLKQWTEVTSLDWQVTSWPMSSHPSTFRQRVTAAVITPASNYLCERCEKGDMKDASSDEDFDPAKLVELYDKQANREQREKEEMQSHDFSIDLVTVCRVKHTLDVSVQRGMGTEALHAELCRWKRVGRATHMLLREIKKDETIDDGDTVYFQPRKVLRGGGKRILLAGLWDLYPVEVEHGETVQDLLRARNWSGMAVWWGHHKLHHKVCPAEVDTMVYLHVTEDDGLPCTFRPRHLCRYSSRIALAELTTYYYLALDGITGWPADDDEEIYARTITLDTAINDHYLRLARRAYAIARGSRLTIRGGSPKQKGHLVWESSRTLRGVQLVTKAYAGDKELTQIAIEEVCNSAVGAVLCLVKTWSAHFQETYAGPIAFIFPGRCSATLRRLGAEASQISEAEAIVEDVQTPGHHIRTVTILSIAEQPVTMGKNLASVEAPLESAVELQIELDERWSSAQVATSAEREWKGTLVHMTAKLAQSNLQPDLFYAIKESMTKPQRMWSARLRLSTPAAEKLLCMSGHDAVFVKPVIPHLLPAADKFTIIWGPRHIEACASSLATIIKRIEVVAGHRGLAHSAISLGLRAPWDRIQVAREAFAPGDARWTKENVGIRDDKHFVVQGVPPQASQSEVASMLRTSGWTAIPQRRRVLKGYATWWCTAAEAPKDSCLRWAEHILLITPEDPETWRQARLENSKKSAKGKGKGKPPVPKNTTAVVGKEMMADPVYQKDPWSGSKWAGMDSSSTSATSTTNAPSTAWTGPADPRIAALTARMDKAEARTESLEGKVTQVDVKITKMNDDISSRFAQVMEGLAAIAEKRAEDRPEKVRRADPS